MNIIKTILVGFFFSYSYLILSINQDCVCHDLVSRLTFARDDWELLVSECQTSTTPMSLEAFEAALERFSDREKAKKELIPLLKDIFPDLEADARCALDQFEAFINQEDEVVMNPHTFDELFVAFIDHAPSGGRYKLARYFLKLAHVYK